MTAAIASSAPPISRSGLATNPWLVAAVVIIPTFMEVLDTTIALVALRYIAGGLSATVDDGAARLWWRRERRSRSKITSRGTWIVIDDSKHYATGCFAGQDQQAQE